MKLRSGILGILLVLMLASCVPVTPAPAGLGVNTEVVKALDVRNDLTVGGDITAAGTGTFGGALAVTGALTAEGAPVLRTTNAGQVSMGQNTITGTLTIAHGLTTPQVAFCALAADSAATGSTCTTTIVTSTVTVKVWKPDGTTAGDAGHLVNWLVAGLP